MKIKKSAKLKGKPLDPKFNNGKRLANPRTALSDGKLAKSAFCQMTTKYCIGVLFS